MQSKVRKHSNNIWTDKARGVVTHNDLNKFLWYRLQSNVRKHSDHIWTDKARAMVTDDKIN